MADSKTFIADLAEMMETDAKGITLESALADLVWDSMAVVSFIAMADAKYGKSVSATHLRDAKTVADLFVLVS